MKISKIIDTILLVLVGIMGGIFGTMIFFSYYTFPTYVIPVYPNLSEELKETKEQINRCQDIIMDQDRVSQNKTKIIRDQRELIGAMSDDCGLVIPKSI